VEHFNALKGVQMFRDLIRDSSEIDWIFPCHSRQIQYSIDVSLNNHALVVILLPENCPRDIVISDNSNELITALITSPVSDARRY